MKNSARILLGLVSCEARHGAQSSALLPTMHSVPTGGVIFTNLLSEQTWEEKKEDLDFYIYNINYIHTYPNICVYIQSFEKSDGEYERVGARCGVYNNVMLGPGQGWDMEDQPRYHHPPPTSRPLQPSSNLQAQSGHSPHTGQVTPSTHRWSKAGLQLVCCHLGICGDWYF